MGIERDFLMRQLLMLFEVIHKILRHRKNGEEDEAIQEIKYFYKCLKIEEDVHKMELNEFVNNLISEKNLTNEQLEMVALVLKEQGEIEKNSEQKTNYFQKAYFLFEKVENESVTFSMDRQMKLAELKNYLS